VTLEIKYSNMEHLRPILEQLKQNASDNQIKLASFFTAVLEHEESTNILKASLVDLPSVYIMVEWTAEGVSQFVERWLQVRISFKHFV
jgi:hypothetical protein